MSTEERNEIHMKASRYGARFQKKGIPFKKAGKRELKCTIVDHSASISSARDLDGYSRIQHQYESASVGSMCLQ
ncbi:hypothetical protein RRG08_034335 [Elysia crispata]|uniref:Uncharacterized protein n=1 Tax=Elysia crispata TaxID=231223 RepID=A0AAE1E852_9GAST|nr:hypothetical protein RRG08_034335 [Elysia crispata]